MMVLTHIITGYVIGLISRYPWLVLLGAIIPDIDLLIGYILPLTHRGFFHSITFALILSGLFYLWKKDSKKSIALGSGILLHLLFDLFTIQNIQLFWPLSFSYSLDWTYTKNILPNLSIWLTYGLVGLLWWKYEKEWKWKYKRHATISFLLIYAISIVLLYNLTGIAYLILQ